MSKMASKSLLIECVNLIGNLLSLGFGLRLSAGGGDDGNWVGYAQGAPAVREIFNQCLHVL
jgi:hypothetical protein